MGYTAENIKITNQFDAAEVSLFSEILFNNISAAASDTEQDIERKIEKLTFLSQIARKTVDIEALPSEKYQLAFIRFLSKLHQQIEALEILTGKTTPEQIERIGKRFAQKTQFPVGIKD